MTNQIKILDAKQINPEKWNNCLVNSSNELIYANYHYLSLLCDNWSGLIIGDYETIFPMPWRKKWGIKYFYAPAFIQQLGFFGNLSNLPLTSIWNAINGFARYGDLFLNYANEFALEKIAYAVKRNFVLNLNASYPSISKDYETDLLRNLNKANKQILLYSSECSIEDVIQLFKVQYHNRFPDYSNENFNQFKKACQKLSSNRQCITRTIFSENKKDLLATAVLLKSNHRIYLIINAINEKGKTISANHYLLDQIIQEFSEEAILFDFEGSEREGIQTFYQNFHPENQPYYHVRINQLPVLVNLIRRIISSSFQLLQFH